MPHGPAVDQQGGRLCTERTRLAGLRQRRTTACVREGLTGPAEMSERLAERAHRLLPDGLVQAV